MRTKRYLRVEIPEHQYQEMLGRKLSSKGKLTIADQVRQGINFTLSRPPGHGFMQHPLKMPERRYGYEGDRQSY